MTLSPFIQKMLFVNQFSIDKGKISLLGDGQVMISSSALLELQEIDQSKIYNLAKKSSKNDMTTFVSHAKVYQKMKDVFLKELADLGKKVRGSDEGAIAIFQHIFNVYGLGEMTIESIRNRESMATVSIKQSTLAEEWLGKNKNKADQAVCTLTAGVIAGMFSYVFDKDVDCIEVSCRAINQEKCVFEVR